MSSHSGQVCTSPPTLQSICHMEPALCRSARSTPPNYVMVLRCRPPKRIAELGALHATSLGKHQSRGRGLALARLRSTRRAESCRYGAGPGPGLDPVEESTCLFSRPALKARPVYAAPRTEPPTSVQVRIGPAPCWHRKGLHRLRHTDVTSARLGGDLRRGTRPALPRPQWCRLRDLQPRAPGNVTMSGKRASFGDNPRREIKDRASMSSLAMSGGGDETARWT